MGRINSSNNDVLYECLRDLIAEEYSKNTFQMVVDYIEHYKKYKGLESPRFNHSFDNWTAIYCWCKKFCPYFLRMCPLLGHHSLRPDNFIFFLRAKHPLAGLLLWPYALLAMIVSIVRVKRVDRHGNEYTDTDGVQLSWMKLEAFEWIITGNILTFFVKKFRVSWDNTIKIHNHNRPEILNLLA